LSTSAIARTCATVPKLPDCAYLPKYRSVSARTKFVMLTGIVFLPPIARCTGVNTAAGDPLGSVAGITVHLR
jgi:hypothetical protein